MENKIYIIGAGAVGKALAVFLTLEGKNVSIIRGSLDGIPSQIETISIQMDNDTILQADIEVSSLSCHPIFDGILVLTNKSYGNEKLAETLKNRAKNATIVLLQNGLGVELPFIEKEFTDIYRCVLFTTCQVVAENLVKFKPVATSQIGIIKGNQENLQYIVNQLNNAIFQFRGE
jgi:2-dehydropantoate 2-reductase